MLDENLLIAPWYAPNISYYKQLLMSNEIIFCGKIRHQKRSFRNRTTILNANGRLRLTIPIEHSRKENQWYKDVKISYAEDWQKNHWNGISASYRKSAFFEYYEHKLQPFYSEKKYTLLFDYNIAMIQEILSILQVDLPFKIDADNYYPNPKEIFTLDESNAYLQVFSDRFSFEPNLSVLDLIFNLGGKNAKQYLFNSL